MITPVPRWLHLSQADSQPRLRLFCFPYAGGGASIYQTWTKNLASNIQVCPVQLPGREGRLDELAYTRLEDLLTALAPVLHPYLDEPFAFFGHSMGALIAFALSCYLREHYHREPIHLFASGRHGPQVQLTDPPPIHNLPDHRFLDVLCYRYGGIPQQLLKDPELMKIFLPLLRADFTLLETYTYSPVAPLGCPITALGGLQDTIVRQPDLARWQELTVGRFTQHLFQGNHFFLNSSRTALLKVVQQALLHPKP